MDKTWIDLPRMSRDYFDEKLIAQMTYGGTNQTDQVSNDFQDGDQDFSPLPTHSPQRDRQDGHEKVCLVSYTIPKHDVVEGIIVSKDPLVTVDGKPLGSDFWKVLVKKTKIQNASLERPRKKFRTVGEAVGCAVAQRSCDVFVEE